jgi:DNA-binding SARP family transcriptional activator
MNVRKAHKIWIEQCEAAQTIKARFGLTAAFDYVVGEKLMNYASAASRHPDFARELPRFVSEVRRIFTPDEIGAHLAQIERAPNENDIDVLEEDDPLRESPAEAEERVRQFLLIKELLTATMLGTS